MPGNIVLARRGFFKHYLIHELIHEAQIQNHGITATVSKPQWYIEGMAYSLSLDPRDKLNPKFEGYRKKFEIWLSEVGKEEMWKAGNDL